SNRGAEADIMAPGGVKAANGKRRVLSTAADNDYKTMYGTSMACPHVSGVAALIIAEYGGAGFTAEQCRERLLQAYRPVGGLADDGDADLGVLGVRLLDAGPLSRPTRRLRPRRYGSAVRKLRGVPYSFRGRFRRTGTAMPWHSSSWN